MGSKTNNWFNELSGRPLKGRRMPGQLGGVDTPAWGRKVLRMNTKFQGPESLEKFKKNVRRLDIFHENCIQKFFFYYFCLQDF